MKVFVVDSIVSLAVASIIRIIGQNKKGVLFLKRLNEIL
jgi:hypothetical protein